MKAVYRRQNDAIVSVQVLVPANTYPLAKATLEMAKKPVGAGDFWVRSIMVMSYSRPPSRPRRDVRAITFTCWPC